MCSSDLTLNGGQNKSYLLCLDPHLKFVVFQYSWLDPLDQIVVLYISFLLSLKVLRAVM